MTEKKVPYLPKVALVRLHTAGKKVNQYREELTGQGFTYRQFEHMKRSDEYWDGLELWVSMWNYDNHESWHLWNWKKEDDNQVMLAMYEAEQFHPYGRYMGDFEKFKADWKDGKYDPGMTYTFPLEAVEVLQIVQEEKDNIDKVRVQREVRKARETEILNRRRERVTKRKYRCRKKDRRGRR